MTKVELVQIIILIVGFLGVGFIPQFFYEKKLNILKHDIQKLNITMEQNHPVKRIHYTDFIQNFFNAGEILDEKARREKFRKSLKEISSIIFLYGSDEAIKSFLILKYESSNEMEIAANGARFIIELRKDLNGGKTDVTPEDYIKLVVDDWQEGKEAIMKYL